MIPRAIVRAIEALEDESENSLLRGAVAYCDGEHEAAEHHDARAEYLLTAANDLRALDIHETLKVSTNDSSN